MTPVGDAAALAGKLTGAGTVVAVDNTGQVSLLSLVYKLKGAKIQVAEQAFDAERHALQRRLAAHHRRGRDDALTSALHDLDARRRRAWPPRPTCAAHAVTAPRIAIMHTWLSTQTEGWWRYAFDDAGVPYDLHQHPDRGQAKPTCAPSTT